MSDENKKVCNQCPNHCPITDLKCSEGRMALKRESEGRTEYTEKEGRRGPGGHHGERGHHKGRMHGGHHGGGRPCMDEDTLPGLMQACGHQIYHRGRRGGGQEGILSILAEKEQMSQKDLQEILQIQPGSMSEILMKLEQKELITREKDREDKRKSIIRLTSAGKESAKEQKPRMDEDNMFSVLNDEEQNLLKTMLKKLLDFWRS